MNPHESGEIPLDFQQPIMSGPAEVVIPDDVRGAWKGIKVEVTDNETGKKELIAIDIGQEKEINGSGLKVKALSFLPAFQMDGVAVTSRSNEMENPAAQIEISEGDNHWKGWLFSLYPTTHAFTHPKYSITLVDGIAAEKATKGTAEKS
ncbi:MAG: DUF2155 domain-containing protein [Proteobacteria bacterium]|nr:DUF2155 domain-containing protein [Pseudomonadota bacterium]